MCKVTLSQPWVPILSLLSPRQKSQPLSPGFGGPQWAPTFQARAPPQPAWPSLPATCPGVSWMPCPPPLAHAPLATTHVCPHHPSVPGAQAWLPGHTQDTAGSLTLCPQAHIVLRFTLSPGLPVVPTRSSQRVALGPADNSRQLGLLRLHPAPGPHLGMSQA